MNPLENWQAIRLNKPLTVNVPYFPEANIVAKEGEKIVVQIPEGSTVYIAIKGGKAGQTILPVIPQQQQPAVLPAAPHHHQQQQHAGAPGGHKNKNAVTYKPKANQPNANSVKNAAPAVTNDASAATGATANGGDAHQGNAGQQQPRGGKNNNNKNPRNRNGNNNNQKGQKNNNANASDVKVITAEELKRQREEQARHEAWLSQRKEFEKKEREEQDRRYKERLERQKKAKEEADARRKKEVEANGGLEEDSNEKEGEKDPGSGKKSCWVCGSENHISRKCSSRCKRSACNTARGAHSIKDCKDTCTLCNNKGHDEWYCDKRCPVCRRGVGDPHLLADCPIECRLCGAKGHRDRECEYSYYNKNKPQAVGN